MSVSTWWTEVLTCPIYVLQKTYWFLGGRVWKLVVLWLRWLSTWIAFVCHWTRTKQWSPQTLTTTAGVILPVLPCDAGQKWLGNMLASTWLKIIGCRCAISPSGSIESFPYEPMYTARQKCFHCKTFTGLWICSVINGMPCWWTSHYVQSRFHKWEACGDFNQVGKDGWRPLPEKNHTPEAISILNVINVLNHTDLSRKCVPLILGMLLAKHNYKTSAILHKRERIQQTLDFSSSPSPFVCDHFGLFFVRSKPEKPGKWP